MALQRKSHRAFTIVELLIAATITVLIVVMLGTIFGSLTKTTSRANQRIDSFRDARAALQMMQRDLSNLVRTQWQPDPFAIPTPSTSPQPVTRAAAYLALKSIYDPTSGNQEVYALVSVKNSGQGDVCSTGYYCSWDGNAYSLRRFFRPSDQTYATLSSPAPTPALSPLPTPAPTPVYKSDADLYKPNPSPSPSPTDEVLARYVWDFEVTAYDAAGKVISGYDSTGTLVGYPYICDPSATTPTQVPSAIEISFKAMSPEAARAVMSVSSDPLDWMDATRPRYKLLVAPNAYEFRTRIKF